MLKESCAKSVTIMLHHVHIEKIIFSLITYFIEAWAKPQSTSPSLCLDYYEMNFLVMKTTPFDATEEG